MTLGLLSKGASRIPMEWVRPLSGVALVVPYYHMVSDVHVPHISHLYQFRTVAEFTADAEFFSRHFEPVTLSDIVDALNGRRTFHRPCVHLTFDDGFREMHDVVAPILQRAGLPATFFLTTAFLDGGGLAHHNVISLLLERLKAQDSGSRSARSRLESLLPVPENNGMTIEQRMLAIKYAQKPLMRSLTEALGVDVDQYVRESQPHLSSEQVLAMLRQGFSIGAHSHDHPLYADLTVAEQLAQTRTSMESLAARFGVEPKSFAFPHTDTGVPDEFFTAVFSERVLDVSFGTSGFVPHFHPRNIERVSMEKTSAPANQILARQYTRAAYLRLRSRKRAEVTALPSTAPGPQ